MSPETWNSAWHAGQLMELPAELIEHYPEVPRGFLTRFDFPRTAEFGIYRFNFGPMLSPFESLGENEYDDMADRLMIGELDIDGGMSFVVAISQTSGQISLVDFDYDMPEAYVNSDLAAFGLSLRAVVMRYTAIKGGAERSENFADEIASELLNVDPNALDNEVCFWFGVVEFERFRNASA